jgi:hypothetical protein
MVARRVPPIACTWDIENRRRNPPIAATVRRGALSARDDACRLSASVFDLFLQADNVRSKTTFMAFPSVFQFGGFDEV